jgi:hypothetical protein
MARDEVPAQPIAQRQRPLQVHPGAGVQLAHGGAAQRLWRRLDLEDLPAALHHREARAIHGDGLAQGKAASPQRRADPEIRHPTWNDTLDDAHILNETGEHPRGL